MKVLLLAAGIGSRLRPLTNAWPKCLMPINRIPLLAYWIDEISRVLPKIVIINTHWKQSDVSNFVDTFNSSVPMKCIYEPELLGTAGTIRSLQTYFLGESFLVIHADNYTNIDLKKFVEFHNSHHYPISMATFRTDQPEKSGIVELDDFGIVQKFHEKVKNPPSNLANAAIYIFRPAVLKLLNADTSISDISTELIPKFIGQIKCFHHLGYNIDIGSGDALRKAQSITRDEKTTCEIRLNCFTFYNRHFNEICALLAGDK